MLCYAMSAGSSLNTDLGIKTLNTIAKIARGRKRKINDKILLQWELSETKDPEGNMKKGNQGDGGGRPPVVLSDRDIIQLEALSSVLTKGQVADYFGICENTLREIEKRQPQVSEAYKRGRAKQHADMGLNLISLAKEGNVTANIFYLKTQAGWKEPESEGDSKQPINVILNAPHEA